MAGQQIIHYLDEAIPTFNTHVVQRLTQRLKTRKLQRRVLEKLEKDGQCVTGRRAAGRQRAYST